MPDARETKMNSTRSLASRPRHPWGRQMSKTHTGMEKNIRRLSWGEQRVRERSLENRSKRNS